MSARRDRKVQRIAPIAFGIVAAIWGVYVLFDQHIELLSRTTGRPFILTGAASIQYGLLCIGVAPLFWAQAVDNKNYSRALSWCGWGLIAGTLAVRIYLMIFD